MKIWSSLSLEVEEEEKTAQNLLRLFCLVKSFESHFVVCRKSYVVSKKTQKVINLISLWFEYVCHINYSQSSSQLRSVANCRSSMSISIRSTHTSVNSHLSSFNQVIWRDQCPKLWLRSHKFSDVIVRRKFNVLCRFWAVYGLMSRAMSKVCCCEM